MTFYSVVAGSSLLPWMSESVCEVRMKVVEFSVHAPERAFYLVVQEGSLLPWLIHIVNRAVARTR
jgi:hypothetical protein